MILLSISILWVAVCVDSISADPNITVSARVGSTALLPCKLNDEFNKTSVIRWSINNKIVFERSSKGPYAGSGYDGRVDVPEDELRKGNCSLVLKNVSITDGGDYKTFVMEHVDRTISTKAQEISRVKLSVVFQFVSARVGSTVTLPCEWRNLSIQIPYVQWNIDSKVVFERLGRESFQGEGYEGRVDVPEDELLKGSCSLVLKNAIATDAGVYRSYMLVELTKKTVQKVKLLVIEKHDKRKSETSAPSGEVRILIISLLVCLLF